MTGSGALSPGQLALVRALALVLGQYLLPPPFPKAVRLAREGPQSQARFSLAKVWARGFFGPESYWMPSSWLPSRVRWLSGAGVFPPGTVEAEVSASIGLPGGWSSVVKW